MFLKVLLDDIEKKNVEFIHLLTQALQFNTNFLSIVPSLLFLIFSMSVVYRITHKSSTRFRRTTYRDALYREIAFQWLYLYVTRAWLYVVRGLRFISTYLEQSVLSSGGSSSSAYCVHIMMFLIFVIFSISPFFLILTIFGTEDTMEQNILFWIPPNRWTRSELGAAGRLMERPPDFSFTNSKFPHAYETKRSVSSENAKTTSSVEIIRYCKSGSISGQVSSLDEITRED